MSTTVYSDLRRLKKLGDSGFLEGPVTFQIYWPPGTVFCPGFQKGRVPSEKSTLAR